MSPFLLLLSLLQLLSSSVAATFTITNNCRFTIWPGILSGAGTAPLSTTGFTLKTGESRSLPVPTGWSGRLWARTLCSTDPSTGKFSCSTGDCGSSTLQCSGAGATPPATLAEFTLNGNSNLDFYDVSLVDGYNLPVLVAPSGSHSSSNCSSTGCLVDLNGLCPSDLRVTTPGSGPTVAACKSACEAFGSPEYCCSGAYADPNTCRPTDYSQVFKSACPKAYSYAYDDATSTFTCAGANYAITFCPASMSQKSEERSPNPRAALPSVNGDKTTMEFMGGDDVSISGGDRRRSAISWIVAVGVTWRLMNGM